MKKVFAFFLLCFSTLVLGDLPFTPINASTKTLACGVATSNVALPTTITTQTASLEIQNAGTVPVFVDWGASTITAVIATGYPILAGQSKVITVAPTTVSIACITTIANQTVYISTGSGY